MFLGGGLTLYIPIFQGAKISLFSYIIVINLAFLYMDHRSFWGGAIGGG